MAGCKGDVTEATLPSLGLRSGTLRRDGRPGTDGGMGTAIVFHCGPCRFGMNPAPGCLGRERDSRLRRNCFLIQVGQVCRLSQVRCLIAVILRSQTFLFPDLSRNIKNTAKLTRFFFIIFEQIKIQAVVHALFSVNFMTVRRLGP